MIDERRQARTGGFSLVEALVALVVFLVVLTIVFTFFVDYGHSVNTQSGTLDTQTSARISVDEIARSIQQAGYNIDRAPSDDPSTWQRDVVYAGSHVFAFNADLDTNIGPIPKTQTVTFPYGVTYDGQGSAAVTGGAETYVYTIDANGDNAIQLGDRTASMTGSYNPAADTPNPLDFALFKRTYGWNGTDYGGALVPVAAGVFTNAVAAVAYPDGTTPEPLFEYWLTEDIDRNQSLANVECVVGTCPPSTTRLPKLYLWGDTDGDGTLSESEKGFIRDKPVGSASWSKNPLVTAGVYNSTTTNAAFTPASAAYLLTVTNASKFSTGMFVQIDTGADTEYAVVESVTTSPHTISMQADLRKPHASGATVQALSTTLLRAVRAVKVHFDAISPVADTVSGAESAGRSGRAGTKGMDYKVTPFDRTVELVNMATDPLVTASSASLMCPLVTHAQCNGSDATVVRAYFPSSAPTPLNFLVQDSDDNTVSGVTMAFSKTNTAGTLSASSGTSVSNGFATVGYTATNFGDSTVTASGSCVDQFFNTITYSDTILVKGTKLTATMTNDCLSTVSSRTAAPSTGFSVQATDSAGPVLNSPVSLSLEFDKVYLPPSPDFTAFRATLYIGGTAVGSTNSSGGFTPWSGDTGGSGTLTGSVVLDTDTVGNGAKVNLVVSAPSNTCWPASGALAQGVTYLKLDLASANPSGCTESSPCLIAAGARAPNVIGTLTINNTPIAGSTVTFTKTDFHPSPDTPPASSIFAPSSSATTDSYGAALVYVTNNASSSITAANPLATTVDATTLGQGFCTSASITPVSPKAKFLYSGTSPAGACDADMQQAWVNGNKQDVCMLALSPSGSKACPLRPTGIKFAVFMPDGVTLDSTKVIDKITGGRTTSSSTDCDKASAVILFQKSCNGNAVLANNTQWNFIKLGTSCELPVASPPGNYFTLDDIHWTADIGSSNRRVDVTLYYGCDNLCSTSPPVSETWSLHADH